MLSKAKPTYMRPVLEDAISKGAFTRDARKAARWALVTIDDLTARLAEAEKKYDELKHVVECNKKLLIENDGLRLSLAAAEAALNECRSDLSSTVADWKDAHDGKMIAETAAFFLLEVCKHTDEVRYEQALKHWPFLEESKGGRDE